MLNNQRVTQTPSFRMVQDLYSNPPSAVTPKAAGCSQSKKLVTHVLHVEKKTDWLRGRSIGTLVSIPKCLANSRLQRRAPDQSTNAEDVF